MSYVRVSILGSMTGGEVWSINPVYDPTLEFPGTVDQVALDAAAAAIANLSPGAGLLEPMSNLLSITGARVEVRDDATDDLIALGLSTRATPLAGTAAPFQAPQTSLVASLRTNTPGASGRGRIYWPALGYQVGSNGRVVPAKLGTFAGAMKTYLLGIESALETAFPTILFNLAVRSRATKTTPHVVRLQAGDIFDTQRRRRDALPESYTATPIP